MNKKRIFAIVSVAVVLIGLSFGVYRYFTGKEKTTDTKPEKTISVTVVYEDETKKEYSITTKQKYLSGALQEKGLLKDSEYKAGDGLYTVIDGVTADYSKDAAWWCVTKEGQQTGKGLDRIVLADKDRYEITYTKG